MIETQHFQKNAADLALEVAPEGKTLPYKQNLISISLKLGENRAGQLKTGLQLATLKPLGHAFAICRSPQTQLGPKRLNH